MESIQGCMVQHFHGHVLWLVILNQCTHAQVKFKCWLVWLSSLETFPQKSNQYKMINNKIIINILLQCNIQQINSISFSLSPMIFSVQIQAVNAIGSSPNSLPLIVRTRPLPPPPPPLECSAAGPQSLKLKWGENTSHTRALLADDMVYTLQMEDKNHRWSIHGPVYTAPSSLFTWGNGLSPAYLNNTLKSWTWSLYLPIYKQKVEHRINLLILSLWQQ